MGYTKKIVCLADSRKNNKHCFAGKEIFPDGSFGEWIRPVGKSATGEVEPENSVYKDGTSPQLLDIISVSVKEFVPHGHQVENYKIDTGFYWRKLGTQPFDGLADLADEPDDIWLENDSSTFHGRHDRVPENVAASIKGSLLLIRPENVTIRVLTPSATFGDLTKAVRAEFQYSDTDYNIKITDRIVEQAYLTQPEGDYELDQDAFFCVSLADPHNGFCYKLVAAVITEQPL